VFLGLNEIFLTKNPGRKATVVEYLAKIVTKFWGKILKKRPLWGQTLKSASQMVDF
jgi:hypothetical protein